MGKSSRRKNIIATSHVTRLFECLESFKNFPAFQAYFKSLIAVSLPILKGSKNYPNSRHITDIASNLFK